MYAVPSSFTTGWLSISAADVVMYRPSRFGVGSVKLASADDVPLGSISNVEYMLAMRCVRAMVSQSASVRSLRLLFPCSLR